MFNFLKTPRVIDSSSSIIHGNIEIKDGWGYKYVSTGYLTQSGGILYDIYNPLLKSIAQNNKTWLILGLGAGTIAQIIDKKYSPIHITGVEIEPKMVEFGYKYFDLDQVKNLDIKILDAQKYIKYCRKKFDYIVVDIYQNDLLPEFVYKKNFISSLKKCLNIDGKLVINHLFYDQVKKLKAQQLVNQVSSIFKEVNLKRILTNMLIIASN